MVMGLAKHGVKKVQIPYLRSQWSAWVSMGPGQCVLQAPVAATQRYLVINQSQIRQLAEGFPVLFHTFHFIYFLWDFNPRACYFSHY